MSKIYWKGSALLSPVPSVMVTCGNAERCNIITIGWCGIISTRPPRLYISVRPERHSHSIIEESREFVVNCVPAELFEVADYCGTVTGRKVDKIARTGVNIIPSKEVAPPTIEESPLSLECRVYDILHSGSHDVFLADIVAVSVDEDLVDEGGKLRLDKRKLLVYSHGEYFEQGRKLGSIGVSVAGKKKGRRATVEKAAKRKK